MSREKERSEFVYIMGCEGVPLHIARELFEADGGGPRVVLRR